MDKKDHKPLHGARKNKKSPKKPCHKRIFQKSGDIFFGATSQNETLTIWWVFRFYYRDVF